MWVAHLSHYIQSLNSLWWLDSTQNRTKCHIFMKPAEYIHFAHAWDSLPVFEEETWILDRGQLTVYQATSRAIKLQNHTHFVLFYVRCEGHFLNLPTSNTVSIYGRHSTTLQPGTNMQWCEAFINQFIYNVLMHHNDYSNYMTAVVKSETCDWSTNSCAPFKLCIYVWIIFLWLSKGLWSPQWQPWYNVVMYDKSIEDNVCSFCLDCTVLNYGSLYMLTPHCCLNVTGDFILWMWKTYILYIFTYNASFFIISLN